MDLRKSIKQYSLAYSRKSKPLQAAILAISFGLIGTLGMLITSAAVLQGIFEAETGTFSASVTKGSDTSASGGEYAQFAATPSSGSGTTPTEPTPEASFTFGSSGDLGANATTAASLAKLDQSGAAFFLALGDLDYDETPTDADYCPFVKNRLPTLFGGNPNFPFQIVTGNHEEQAGPDGYIMNHAACLPDKMNSQGFYPAQYYFDYPTVNPLMRVIMISPDLQVENVTYTYAKSSTHYTWLSSAIDQARTAGVTWVTVGMHKNCITAGVKPCNLSLDLVNLLIDKKVDLVLQGHEHNYQRSKQLAINGTTCTGLDGSTYNSSCVVPGSDPNVYTKGAGTVTLINGIFGRDGSSYPINTADPSYPYMAVTAANSTNRGFTKWTVTPTSISGELVSSAGSLADTFFITASGNPPGPGDTISPSISLTSPANGLTVTGAISLAATASDNVGVAKVEFYIDGGLVGTDMTSPYSISWNSAGVNDGPHTAYAKAFDGAGNSANSAEAAISALNSCSVPVSSSYGRITSMVNVPIAGQHTLWVRIMAPDQTNNSVGVGIGSECPRIMGDNTSIPSNSWTWVNYADGNTSSVSQLNLPAGSQTITILGNEATVKIDKILLLNDNCVPIGFGDNCTTDIDATPPTAPSGLIASAGGPTQVNLTWNEASDTGGSGLAGYRVTRNGQVIATVTTNSYLDNTVTANTVYSYTVVAYDVAGNTSPVSNTASITTPSSTTPLILPTKNPAADTYILPGTPNGNFGTQTTLRADNSPIEHSLLKFNVDDINGRQVISAKLRIYCTNSGSGGEMWATVNTTWAENTATWNNAPAVVSRVATMPTASSGQWVEADVSSLISSNGTYSLRMQSTSTNGMDFGSREATNKPQLIITVQGVPAAPDTTPPTVNVTTPAANDAVSGTASISVSATDNGTISKAEFLVDDQLVQTINGAGPSFITSWNTKLFSNGAHNIVVNIYDSANNKGSSTVPVTVNNDVTPPTVPTGLAATAASSTQVNLLWDAATDNVGVAAYYVQRDGVVVATLGGTTLAYTDNDLMANTGYSYTIVAGDTAGNASSPSAAATATTQPAPVDTTPPTTPTSLTATAPSSTQVNLSWNAATDVGGSGLAGYHVTRNGQVIATITTISYLDGTVTAASLYNYTVTAIDGAGNTSPVSNTASVTTPSSNLPQTLAAKNPVADTYILSSSPTVNNGTKTTLLADNSPIEQSLLKFNVTGINGRMVVSAKLRLYCTNPSTTNAEIWTTATDTWLENLANWNNAPATVQRIATMGSVASSKWVEMDVTSMIYADGIYSMRMLATGSDGRDFHSREATNKPQLVITVR